MPGPKKGGFVLFFVILSLSFTSYNVLANEVFSGVCDTCHDFGGSTGPWHNSHMNQACINHDCDYCHIGPALARGKCNECHRGLGTANHHDCSGADTGCVTCHTDPPPSEETDYTPCLNECGDGLDNDGDCAYDSNDADCPHEICNDQVDNDGDLLVDCDDPDCLGVLPEICTDGIDNDCDGQVDGNDPNCVGACTAGAQASTRAASPVYGTPGLFTHAVPLFCLAGVILLWRTARRKR